MLRSSGASQPQPTRSLGSPRRSRMTLPSGTAALRRRSPAAGIARALTRRSQQAPVRNRTPGTINLVHTGSLSIPERRDPRGFFEALETLVAEDAELASKLRLTLAGSLTSRDRRLLEELSPRVRPMVNELGPLPRSEALALQRELTSCCCSRPGPHRQVVTAKLSEYLLAGSTDTGGPLRERSGADHPRDAHGCRRRPARHRRAPRGAAQLRERWSNRGLPADRPRALRAARPGKRVRGGRRGRDRPPAPCARLVAYRSNTFTRFDEPWA